MAFLKQDTLRLMLLQLALQCSVKPASALYGQ